MGDVLFDYTRVMSALGRRKATEPERAHLFLWDLAKCVEAIVLYDHIHTTEFLKGGRSSSPDAARSRFDLSKPQYDAIFDEVFCDNAGAGHPEVGGFLAQLDLERREYGPRRFAYGPDIDLLPELRREVDVNSFQYLGGYVYQSDDFGLLQSMARVRMLLTVSSVIGAPYDPVAFREPLVRRMTPGNLQVERLQSYRRFETDLRSYLSGLTNRDSILRVPLFFALAIRESRTGFPDDIFKVALQLRKEKKIGALRTLLDDVNRARLDGDVELVARVNRIVQEQLEAFSRDLSGKLSWPMSVELKLGWLPLEISLDVQSLIQRFKDRKIYPAFAHLRKLTKRSLIPLTDLANETRRVLDVVISEDDIRKLPDA